MYKNIH